MEKEIKLTEKERKVLKYIANGMDDKRIAVKLDCSYATVRLILMGLFKTFRTNKRAEMIYLACKNGILN